MHMIYPYKGNELSSAKLGTAELQFVLLPPPTLFIEKYEEYLQFLLLCFLQLDYKVEGLVSYLGSLFWALLFAAYFAKSKIIHF